MMKCIKWMLILFFTAFLSFAIYLESGGNFILNHSDKQLITYEIRSCKKLPENFTSFYNTVYPNSLFSDSWSYVTGAFLKPRSSRRECPCNQTANRFFPILEIRNKKGIDQFLTARYIEHQFTQQECLASNFNKFDFLENRKGLSQVSQSLFNKKTEDLKPFEMAEILAIYEGPVKNNRHRNPEKARKRAAHFYKIYLNNSKTGN
ncbi:transglycosylase domain-containing protein [uncultured Chryseobacterium sp.]|uniref:transglycosylase domain-containing protein n=1 Tax=uncultured Chryseobacterium sp. TaxID=259322 RepID=UPI0025F5B6FC|nr:transglycosylase domain-containing protein [uncultured Chryseobacterium sp.]